MSLRSIVGAHGQPDLSPALAQTLLAEGVLEPGAPVFNSSWRWSKYGKTLEACGLRSLKWGGEDPGLPTCIPDPSKA